jgi:cytochrome b6-f complex iron-sulfur subunit
MIAGGLAPECPDPLPVGKEFNPTNVQRLPLSGVSMDRKEFLSVLGLGAAAVACSYCLEGCNPADQGPTAPQNVDFTIDLNASANSALRTVGGYLYNSGVIVVRTTTGYLALSSICTHQGATVTYDASTNSFYCPAHGSIFSSSGAVTRGPAGSPLTVFKTTLSGTSLRVYS